jgi:hypothetical protein
MIKISNLFFLIRFILMIDLKNKLVWTGKEKDNSKTAKTEDFKDHRNSKKENDIYNNKYVLKIMLMYEGKRIDIN